MNQAMTFIKANVVALLCALVALLALIAYFIYPIPGMFQGLQTEVEARKPVHDTLTGLLTAERTLPVVDPDKAAEPQKLTVFPTNRVIEQGTKALAALQAEAKNVLDLAIRMNQRPLLVSNSLPNPSSIVRNEFLNAYKKETAQIGPGAEMGIVRRVLHGTLPPSDAEVNALFETRRGQIIKDQLIYDSRNTPVNQAVVEQRIAEMKAALPLNQRLVRALNNQIYVSPGAVDIHPALIGITPPDAVTVFNGQFSLWLQTNAFESIAAANAGAKNVLDAPVKHLVRLWVPMDFVPATAGGGGGGGGFGFGGGGGMTDAPAGDPAAAGPVELKPDPAAAITPNYLTDPLGYTHNTMYDPIPIHLTIRVDARRLPEILAAMQSGRLLKVRNVNYRTVDTGVALQQGYIYDQTGTTPLIEVALECDVLMLRPWLVNYMPEAAKRHFASLSTPAAPPQ